LGFFSSFKGKKVDPEAAEKLVREYVDGHFEAFLTNWAALMEDLGAFGEIDKKSLLRDETSRLTFGASEILKSQKIKVPAHIHILVRDELNEKVMEPIRKHVSEFVYSYRKPYQPWPNEIDIPMKDMEKIKKILAEDKLHLDLLSYDLGEEKIRWMLQQYGIRRKPQFQDNESWTKNFSYSHEDIIHLGLILQSKNIRIQAIEHALGDLRLLVKQELLAQQDRQFQSSLRKANPLLTSNPTKKEWAAAYVKALRTDLDYLPYLTRVTMAKGVVFEKGELENLIRAELKNRNLIHD
jgi:hypothetical protein